MPQAIERHVGRRIWVTLKERLADGSPIYEGTIVERFEKGKRLKVKIAAPGDFWNNQILRLPLDCQFHSFINDQ